MSDVPESIKIKMLADAGFHPTLIQERYLKLIDFVQRVSNLAIPYCSIDEDAEKLLESMGESNV